MSTYAKVITFKGEALVKHYHEPYGRWMWPYEGHDGKAPNAHRDHDAAHPIWVAAHVSNPTSASPTYKATAVEKALYAKLLNPLSAESRRVKLMDKSHKADLAADRLARAEEPEAPKEGGNAFAEDEANFA